MRLVCEMTHGVVDGDDKDVTVALFRSKRAAKIFQRAAEGATDEDRDPPRYRVVRAAKLRALELCGTLSTLRVLT